METLTYNDVDFEKLQNDFENPPKLNPKDFVIFFSRHAKERIKQRNRGGNENAAFACITAAAAEFISNQNFYDGQKFADVLLRSPKLINQWLIVGQVVKNFEGKWTFKIITAKNYEQSAKRETQEKRAKWVQ